MPKHKGFTLIEVLVAVMIISVVISALLQLFANNSYTFSSVHQKILQTNMSSLLLGNEIYGYEDKKMDLSELVKDFNVNDDLRRKLKDKKIEIIYTEVTSFNFDDAAESLAEAEEESGDNDEGLVTETSEVANTLEIGRTTIKIDNESSSFLRVKFQ